MVICERYNKKENKITADRWKLKEDKGSEEILYDGGEKNRTRRKADRTSDRLGAINTDVRDV